MIQENEKMFPELDIRSRSDNEHRVDTTVRVLGADNKWYLCRVGLHDIGSKKDVINKLNTWAYRALLHTNITMRMIEKPFVDTEFGNPIYRLDKDQRTEKERMEL